MRSDLDGPIVAVKKVDLSSHDALVSVLQGADVLLLTVAQVPDFPIKTLIDASIAAGVRRIIPNNFGACVHYQRNIS